MRERSWHRHGAHCLSNHLSGFDLSLCFEMLAQFPYIVLELYCNAIAHRTRFFNNRINPHGYLPNIKQQLAPHIADQPHICAIRAEVNTVLPVCR